MKAVLFVVLGVLFASAVFTSPDVVRTPYGLVHRECVLELASGSSITPLADGIRIRHANGTHEHRAPCAHEPRAVLQPHTQAKKEIQQHLLAPTADTFYSHFWYGMTYTPFLDVVNITSSWTVPDRPVNMQPSKQFGNEPTESWWIGIQDNGVLAVLQPVIEINDLDPNGFDAASWNCCPSGYTVHSTPLSASAGDAVWGSIAQTDPSSDAYTYEIVTQVNGEATSLYADMTQLNNWTPYVAQAIYEAYYVGSCDQLTASQVVFSNMTLATTDGEMVPGQVQWTEFFVTASGSGTVMCDGSATENSFGSVTIEFDTTA